MKRIALVGIGILAVLFGLVWIGQGSGYFPYPASSFMIAQPQWMLYGAILVLLGIAAVVAGRRM